MESNPVLVERVDDVPSFLQRAGHFYTSTGHQAFGVIKALGWHPWVRMGEELFFPEGSVLFWEVRPISADQLTPNVERVDWGTTEDFYIQRLRDYDNWEVAFWREVIQNSRDSRATRIDLECVEDTYRDPETGESVACMRASVSDNGSGMDYETLMTAFFRRGGTQKGAGSVGGFGDAKNLILTPWLGYEVRTRDVVARGRHEALFADLTKQGMPYHDGTKVSVWMPLTTTTTADHAQFLIEQSSLPQIRFTVNGKTVRGTVPRGKLVDEKPIRIDGQTVGTLETWHSARASRTGVYVRSHGIYMYEWHNYDGDFKGVVTVEINAPPINVFTTKRDALSYKSTARADVDDIIKRLATDPRKALKAKRDKKEVIFRGTGSITAHQGRVAELAAEAAAKADLQKDRPRPGAPTKLSKETVTKLIAGFEHGVRELGGGVGGEPGGGLLAPLPSSFGTLVSQTEFGDVEQIAGALQVSMWQPDFFLYQNISPWTMPSKLHPEKLQHKYHVLLRVWTEVCKFLLVQFGLFRPFGVGWVFDAEYDPELGRESVIAAMYRKHDGMDWLLLNPVEIEMTGWTDSDPSFSLSGDRFNLANMNDIERLVTLAVHEVTHMQGYLGHNDAYASALTTNMQAVFRIAPVLRQVIKEARASVRESRAAAKEAAEAARAARERPAPVHRREATSGDSYYSWEKDNADFYSGKIIYGMDVALGGDKTAVKVQVEEVGTEPTIRFHPPLAPNLLFRPATWSDAEELWFYGPAYDNFLDAANAAEAEHRADKWGRRVKFTKKKFTWERDGTYAYWESQGGAASQSRSIIEIIQPLLSFQAFVPRVRAEDEWVDGDPWPTWAYAATKAEQAFYGAMKR